MNNANPFFTIPREWTKYGLNISDENVFNTVMRTDLVASLGLLWSSAKFCFHVGVYGAHVVCTAIFSTLAAWTGAWAQYLGTETVSPHSLS
jgi:hypothetical protein